MIGLGAAAGTSIFGYSAVEVCYEPRYIHELMHSSPDADNSPSSSGSIVGMGKCGEVRELN